MNSRTICFFFILSTWLTNCNDNKLKVTEKEKSMLPTNLIQICIDSTLVLDSKINTPTFYVDLEYLRKKYQSSVAIYLTENKNLKSTNFDSLINVKSPWLKKDFFQNDIIRFEKVEIRKDNTILVETTKRRAVDASFGTEIILRKEGDKVICLKSNITWIN